MIRLFILLIVPLVCCGTSVKYFQSGTPPGEETVCGYESCPKLNPAAKVHLHIVPHSHDDVGWLKTVDQYYYGAKNYIQRAGVQYIIDSVVKELALDPKKRYIQVETAFFWRWWVEQDDETKEMVKQMVNEGRLEFIGGGWAMHDEATVHYSALIDNMAFGMKQLKDWFGNCSAPRVGWQIDPFGHSSENARLFNWFGFHGLFFARNDYREKDQMIAQRTLDQIWNAGETMPGLMSKMYTEVQIHHYQHPEGFCFDVNCDDEPIMDNPELEEYNVDRLITRFIEIIQEDTTYFMDGPANRHIIYAMGGDFQYQNANQNFKNLDKLIKYVNERTTSTGIEAIYSTPSCYLKGLHDENVNNFPDYVWAEKNDDFFPYASGPDSYWTGYFVSRPTLKYMERTTNNLLQAAKQVRSLCGNELEVHSKIYANQSSIDVLKRAMGNMQHHDAVTGTEKQHVADDYALSMAEGTEAVMSFMGPILFNMAGTPAPLGGSDFLCPLVNISQCHLTESDDNSIILIYNPLARPISKMVRFPVKDANIAIHTADNSQLYVEFVPIPEAVKGIPGRDSESVYDAIFVALDLPPLGYRAYYLEKNVANAAGTILQVEASGPEEAGLVGSPAFYLGSQEEPQPSGAYVFRPAVQQKSIPAIDQVFKVKGQLVEEFWVSYNTSYLSLIQRKYALEDHFYEVEWLAGPLPQNDDDDTGTEIVMVYGNVETTGPIREGKQEFFTDSNGRQMMRRLQDTRFSYDLGDGAEIQPVTSNYYPINSAVYAHFEGFNQTWSVLVDRSQGASSLAPDQLEVMVHRRLFRDDHFGVAEPLDEMAFGQPLVARGKHFVKIGDQQTSSSTWRRLTAQELYMGALVMYQPTRTSLLEWLSLDVGQKEFSMLSEEAPLPLGVHLMTVERWDDPDGESEGEIQILLRFENLFEAHEAENPTGVQFTINQDFFRGYTILELTELSLGGDRPIEDVLFHGLHWSGQTQGFPFVEMKQSHQNGKASFIIDLFPMAIRTFKARLSRSK